MTRRSFVSTLGTSVAATLLMMSTLSSAMAKEKTGGLPVRPPDGTFSTEEAFFAELAKTFTLNPINRYFTPAQKWSMPMTGSISLANSLSNFSV